MSAPSITPHHPGPSISHEELDYATMLYQEGRGIEDPELRVEHLDQVGELIRDIDLAEQLGQRIASDRERTLANIAASRARRAEIAGRNLENVGVAFIAPSFSQQVDDPTRKATFTFAEDVKHGSIRENQHETTEAEGLQELDDFLSIFLSASRQADGSFKYPELAAQARSMLENLTFIGDKEYAEATRGLGAYWKHYLDADPNRQLCVVAGISDSRKYPGQRKSDDYLRDNILDGFTDEELERYSGRIVTDLADLKAAPEDARIILLDDWTITGDQLRRVYSEQSRDPKFKKYDAAGSVEINLVAAGPTRIHNGLPVNERKPNGRSIRVRSYYQAHRANEGTASKQSESHITGLHSAVNYGFEEPINKGMTKVMVRLGKLRRGASPIALANIVRPYRNSSRKIDITPTRLSRKGSR